MIPWGCACVDVDVGSYANQVVLPIPDHMAAYRDARLRAGLSATVCVDRCIAPEVQALWMAGVRTTGSCCGHNRQTPFIGVFPEDIGRMKTLGYEVQPNPCRPGDEDSFWPRLPLTLPLKARGAEALQRLEPRALTRTLPGRGRAQSPHRARRRGHVSINRQMESTLVPVRPVKPVAPYIGGKRGLAARLVQRISVTPHDLYAEAFVGMAGVFLRRPLRPKVEVINDWSADVATLFRILQRHYVAFLDMLRFQLTTREAFDRLVRTDPSTLTDLERAARFLYLQRVAFGGKVNGRNFAMTPDRPARFDVTRLQPLLEELHERLAGVLIERLPYAEFIRRYDRPGALLFLDPPYWGCEDDYGPGMFSAADFEALRDLLEGLQGRFIMTINDAPETRELFGRFDLEPVQLTYRISGTPTVGRELIVTGGGR